MFYILNVCNLLIINYFDVFIFVEIMSLKLDMETWHFLSLSFFLCHENEKSKPKFGGINILCDLNCYQ